MPNQNKTRILKYLAELNQLENQCRLRRTRYWQDDYLIRLYELYMNWKRKGLVKARRKDLLKYAPNLQCPRADQTVVHLLLACTSTVSAKNRNKWVLALLFAASKKISSDDFGQYLRAGGGISKLASNYSKQRAKRRTNKGALLKIK